MHHTTLKVGVIKFFNTPEIVIKLKKSINMH